MNNIKNNREAAPELLRVISMFMIVLGHYASHGTLDIYDSSVGISLSQLFMQILSACGNIGSNIFFLLSGWYILQNKVKLEKLLRIALQVFWCSVIAAYVLVQRIQLPDLCPIIFKKYWFITAYIGLYIFSPYLKKLATALSKIEYGRMLLLAYTCISLIPFLTNGVFIYGDFQYAVFLYMLGGYLKIHGLPDRIVKWEKQILLVICICLVGCVCGLHIMGQYIPVLKGHASFFNDKSSPFVMALSFFIVSIFVRGMNIPYNRFLTVISSGTLGCYLLHENPHVKVVLWQMVDNGRYSTDSVGILINAFVVSVAVYLLCSLMAILMNTATGCLVNIYQTGKDKFIRKNG